MRRPRGARGLRILYATTRADGAPALASALVLIPTRPATAPRSLIVWTHGTTGVAPGCAPSLLAEPFANVPALAEAMTHGWVVVATDYTGLGTEGMHPYLIGAGEARSALDSIRAARQVPALGLSSEVVVWGHSQGGHAALWTGILAPTYAADAGIVGIAALAPASDLPALVERAQTDPAGKIISSYLVAAYRAHYPAVQAQALLRSGARWAADDMARRCMADWRALPSVAEALAVRGSLFEGDPRAGAFGEALRKNSPEYAIAAPVWVAQGGADTLVAPAVQRAYVARRCAAGQAMQFREYPALDHLTLVGTTSPLVPDLIAWTQARFAHAPFATTCAAATGS
jgi:pimeloyl-ACP methyl ester carboxylesterase